MTNARWHWSTEHEFHWSLHKIWEKLEICEVLPSEPRFDLIWKPLNPQEKSKNGTEEFSIILVTLLWNFNCSASKCSVVIVRLVFVMLERWTICHLQQILDLENSPWGKGYSCSLFSTAWVKVGWNLARRCIYFGLRTPHPAWWPDKIFILDWQDDDVVI